jgi:hypothetical protein
MALPDYDIDGIRPSNDTAPASDEAPPSKRIGEPTGKPKVPGSGPAPKAPGDAYRNREAKAPQSSTHGYESGNDYIDKGALCDREPGRDTCFMQPGQRHRMIGLLGDAFVDAGHNYKSAVEALRVDTLLKKDDDLGWIRNLVLDTLVGRFMTVLGDGLAAARGVVGQGDWIAAARTRIDTRVRSAVDGSKKALVSQATASQNKTKTNDKAAKLDYLSFLSEQANESFAQLRFGVPGEATDAELVWLFESFNQRGRYSVSTFKAALGDKLQRFHQSGIDKIGQSWEEGGAISRHTRVVALHFTSGHPTEHWLEKSDMGAANMDGADMRADRFEHSAPKTAKPELVSRIPAEFVEAALARQAQLWGTAAMGFRQIDESEHDPMIYGRDRWQKAKDKHERDRTSAAKPGGPA